MKILLATEKPFAAAAVNGIREIVENEGHELVLLEKYTDKAQLIEAVSDADAMIVRSDKVTADVIDAAKNLKVVVRAGAGYDNIDTKACTEKGIVVENTPGQNANAVAELAIAMIIFMSGNFARISRSSSTVIVRFSTTTLSFRRLFISPSAIAPMACFIDTHLGMVLPRGRIIVSSKSNSSFRCTDSWHMASTSAGSFWYFPLERVSSTNCSTESSGSTGQLSAWMSGELPTPLATRVTDAPPATAASAALHPARPPPIIITSLLTITIAVLDLFRFLLREPRHP